MLVPADVPACLGPREAITELVGEAVDASFEGSRETRGEGLERRFDGALGHVAQEQLGGRIELVVLAAPDDVEGDPAKLPVDPVPGSDARKATVEPVGNVNVDRCDARFDHGAHPADGAQQRPKPGCHALP